MNHDQAFRIKICGVTRLEDVETICESGADAIGLNFYPGSSRFVSQDLACQLRDCAGDRLRVVGVWVNEPAERIMETAKALSLDAIQLHGDEPLQTMQALADHTVVRAMRHPFDPADLLKLESAVNQGCGPSAVLIDSAGPGTYGGTGIASDWRSVRVDSELLHGLPVILAGGLTPETVGEAIGLARPDGVDVASGVEQSSGIKDAALVQRFVEAARLGLKGR